MPTSKLLALLAAISLLLPAVSSATQVSSSTYRCMHPQLYGRTDGWCLKLSDYSWDLIVNGSSVASISATGAMTFPSLTLTGDLTVTGNDITFGNTGTISNATNGTLTFGETSETATMEFTNNLITLASGTGAVYAFTDALTLNGGATLSSGATITQSANNVVTFTENSENFEATFASNLVTFDSTTAATFAFTPAVAFAATSTYGASGKIDTVTNSALVLSYNDVIRFCGLAGGAGAAGATTYIGPKPTADLYGSAGCDALTNDTEATADNVVSPLDFKAFGLRCGISAGGTDDTVTFQARDDAADITGLTCDVVLDGAAIKNCSVALTTPVAVAKGSALAVKISETASGGADDLDALDVECELFVTK